MAKAKSTAIAPSVDKSDVAELIFQVSLIGHALNTTRNLSCVYADLMHEVPAESSAVSLDTKALRGTMTFLTAQLDEALESLAMVSDLLSQIETTAA